MRLGNTVSPADAFVAPGVSYGRRPWPRENRGLGTMGKLFLLQAVRIASTRHSVFRARTFSPRCRWARRMVQCLHLAIRAVADDPRPRRCMARAAVGQLPSHRQILRSLAAVPLAARSGVVSGAQAFAPFLAGRAWQDESAGPMISGDADRGTRSAARSSWRRRDRRFCAAATLGAGSRSMMFSKAASERSFCRLMNAPPSTFRLGPFKQLFMHGPQG